MELHLSDKTIYENLEIASQSEEFIITELRHRKLGKTTALIQFAKDNGYVVLVQSTTMAKYLIKQFGFERIVSVNSDLLERSRAYVFDEGVTKKQIENLRVKGFYIVTRFMTSERFYEPPVQSQRLEPPNSYTEKSSITIKPERPVTPKKHNCNNVLLVKVNGNVSDEKLTEIKSNLKKQVEGGMVVYPGNFLEIKEVCACNLKGV